MKGSRQWIEDEILVDIELRLRSHFVDRRVQFQELRVRQFEAMFERVTGGMEREVAAGFADMGASTWRANFRKVLEG